VLAPLVNRSRPLQRADAANTLVKHETEKYIFDCCLSELQHALVVKKLVETLR
jgi:hypothetical protein